jgi:predicted AlkP superfamily phosphohydrolase/phosphomutase
MTSSTIIVGLCGAAHPGLDALIEDGSMPFLRAWTTSGARAKLQFSTPLSSAAAWTTLITGRSPAQHGIFNLFRKQSPQGHQLRALSSRDIACDALWTRLDREGRRTTVLEYPLTFPPPRIDGHVLPGSWTTPRQLKLGSHPSDLFRRLSELGVVSAESFAIDWSQEKDAAWIKAQIERETQVFNTLRFLMEHEPSDLTVILVRAFGAVQSCYERDPQTRAACVDYFRALDNHLAGLTQPGANVLFVSEPHGGTATRTFFVNAWLAARGYVSWAGGEAPRAPESNVLDTDQLNRQSKHFDWAQTRAYTPLAGGGEIYLLRQDSQHPGGVPDAEYERLRNQLIEELTREDDVTRVWKREELYSGPHVELAPDLVIEAVHGVALSPFADSSEPVSNSGGEGGETGGVFIAGGPVFRHGAVLSPISLLDIAPLLLYSLDLSVPGDLEGRVPTEALDPAWLESRPVHLGPKAAERAPEARVLDPQAEDIILRRLQELGYLE